MITLAATGHRPDRLEGGHSPMTRRALGALAVEHLHYNRPDHVLTGMALGWDQAVAAACVILEIPFTAAVPFKDQPLKWARDCRERYDLLLGHAAAVEVVSLYPGDRAFELRNRWMVDNCTQVAALWDGDPTGGTARCVRYARQKHRPVVNLWPLWIGPDAFDNLLG